MVTKPINTRLYTHIPPRDETFQLCLTCMKKRSAEITWDGNMKCYKCCNCGAIIKVYVEPYGPKGFGDAVYQPEEAS